MSEIGLTNATPPTATVPIDRNEQNAAAPISAAAAGFQALVSQFQDQIAEGLTSAAPALDDGAAFSQTAIAAAAEPASTNQRNDQAADNGRQSSDSGQERRNDERAREANGDDNTNRREETDRAQDNDRRADERGDDRGRDDQGRENGADRDTSDSGQGDEASAQSSNNDDNGNQSDNDDGAVEQAASSGNEDTGTQTDDSGNAAQNVAAGPETTAAQALETGLDALAEQIGAGLDAAQTVASPIALQTGLETATEAADDGLAVAALGPQGPLLAANSESGDFSRGPNPQNANQNQALGQQQAALAGAQVANDGEDGIEVLTPRQAQAQEIARVTGGNTPIQVTVSNEGQSGQVTTQSATSLTAASAIAASAPTTTADDAPSSTASSSGQQVAAAVAGQQTQQANQLNRPATPATTVPQGPQTQQITPEARGPIQASSGAGQSSLGTLTGDGQASQTASGGDGTQRASQAQQAQSPTRAADVPRQQVLQQVTVQLSRAVAEGLDRINIRLNPAELGRVEVRLEVGADGRTTAFISADRAETLDLLRRESNDLAKALQDAGLDLASTDLDFNLKGENAGDGEEETADGGAVGDEEADGFVEDGDIVAAHELGVLVNGRIDVKA